MQPKHKLFKKLFIFGLVFILLSFPLLLILGVKTSEFFTHLKDLSSDKGLICALFSIGIVFVFIGLFFRVFTKG